MSVWIPKLEMPDCCFDCKFRDKAWDECKCPPTRGSDLLLALKEEKRPNWCPLAETKGVLRIRSNGSVYEIKGELLFEREGSNNA